MSVVLNGRAAARTEIGGVERYAREIIAGLTAHDPGRYRLLTPPRGMEHRAGHLWEQAVLPLQSRGATAIYCPANLAPVASRRAVVVLHDTAPLSVPEAYSRTYVGYQRRMLPAIAARAQHIITVSQFSRAEITERLGVAPNRISVIAPGVDERFATAAAGVARNATSATRPPYALAVGTASARKGHDLLEPTARALAEHGVELRLAGGTRGYLPERPDEPLGARTQPCGVSAPGAVRRLGYVPDAELPGLYAGARMLLMPSRYEGFGLPCIEAMAAGVPVLALRAGALPETCADAAMLTDPDDPAAFASAAARLHQDTALRATLIERGHQRAAHFSWSAAVACTDALLKALDEAGRGL